MPPKTSAATKGQAIAQQDDARLAAGWPSIIVLVRHGESEHNVASAKAVADKLLEFGAGIRQPDIPLTAAGVSQAVATGRYLGGHFKFHRVFVSPYLRTAQTAQHVIGQFPYEAVIRFDERIRERELGTFDGFTDAGLQLRYPDEFARSRREGKYWYRPPGGESYPDVALRIDAFLNSMRRNFSGKPILVVTHGIAMWIFRRLIERLSENQLLSHQNDPDQKVFNCAVAIFKFDSNISRRPKLQEWNKIHY